MFFFVEGGLDRPFVDRMAHIAFPGKTWQHQVIGMKEFPSGTGGKPALLSLFRLLRKNRQLDYLAFGKRMVCAFFADKDIDDLTRKRVRSPHFIYTKTYDLEGHLFHSGNLIDAISDACLVTRQQAAALAGNSNAWLQRHAANWKEWLVLCIISYKNSVNTGCSYKRPSNINPNFLGQTDAAALATQSAALQRAVGVTPAQFQTIFHSIETNVSKSLSSPNPLRYFKGKWLQLILQKHLEASPVIPDANFQGAGERVVSTLVSQAGTRTPCRLCSPFVGELQLLGASLP